MAHLVPPTAVVRDSYLAGETEAAIEEGLPTDWLQEAAADFPGFVEPEARYWLPTSRRDARAT